MCVLCVCVSTHTHTWRSQSDFGPRDIDFGASAFKTVHVLF